MKLHFFVRAWAIGMLALWMSIAVSLPGADPPNLAADAQQAIVALDGSGALVADKDGKDTERAEDVRLIHFFSVGADQIKSLSNLAKLPHAEDVTLELHSFQPSQSKSLAEMADVLATLEEVSIVFECDKKAPVTDAELCHISKIPNVSLLSATSLKRLDVSDSGLKCLSRLPELKVLTLNSGIASRVTDEGLVNLKELKKLWVLQLMNSRITGKGFRHLDQVPIQRLILWNCPITDDGLLEIGKLKKLEYLLLDNTQVGDEGLRHLANLPDLERLILTNTKVSGSGLVHMKSLPKLQILGLANTKVTAKFLEHLADCRQLSELDLSECPIDDEAIPFLALLTQLKKISLDDTKLTKAGLERLSKLLPGTKILH
jgi:hypothetical protein